MLDYQLTHVIICVFTLQPFDGVIVTGWHKTLSFGIVSLYFRLGVLINIDHRGLKDRITQYQKSVLLSLSLPLPPSPAATTWRKTERLLNLASQDSDSLRHSNQRVGGNGSVHRLNSPFLPLPLATASLNAPKYPILSISFFCLWFICVFWDMNKLICTGRPRWWYPKLITLFHTHKLKPVSISVARKFLLKREMGCC